MIKILKNSLTDNDIIKLFNLWVSHSDSIIENNRSHAQLDILLLMPFINELNLNYMHESSNYMQLQMQCQDESWGKNEYENSFHTHEYSDLVYVQYLNDNYDGGRIIFETGEKIKPKKGDTIIFPGSLKHYVETPTNFKEQFIEIDSNIKFNLNKRWVVAAFLNPIKSKNTTKPNPNNIL